EHAMDVRVRIGLRRGHDIVELDERMAGSVPSPLAITVEGNSREPRSKQGVAAKGGEARGRTNPGFLQKVTRFRAKGSDKSAQHAVDRRRVTSIEADKRPLVTLGESPDQDSVDWIILVGHAGTPNCVATGGRNVPSRARNPPGPCGHSGTVE